MSCPTQSTQILSRNITHKGRKPKKASFKEKTNKQKPTTTKRTQKKTKQNKKKEEGKQIGL